MINQNNSNSNTLINNYTKIEPAPADIFYKEIQKQKNQIASDESNQKSQEKDKHLPLE